MPIEPPSFFRPGGRSPARFGMGRRVRVRDDAESLVAGCDGVVERVLAQPEGAPFYRIRVALSDLGAARRGSESTLDIEVAEAALAPFFDYGADPAGEAARIEARQAREQGDGDVRPLPRTTTIGALFGLARPAVVRAWADPEFARRLIEAPVPTLKAVDRNIDLPALIGEAGLIVLPNSEREAHRLIEIDSRKQLGDGGWRGPQAHRLHQMDGARSAAFVLPQMPVELNGASTADLLRHITPEMLTGATPPQE